MKSIMLLIPAALCLTGCLNPTLCGSEQFVGKKGFAPEHIEFFKDKPVQSVAEAHGTLLPLAHMREHLEKKSDGFRYTTNVSFLGGLLLEGGYVRHLDNKGQQILSKQKSIRLNMLSGLLFELGKDTDGPSGSYSKSFLFKAFGSTQEIGGSKYYTLFWMPMRFSDQTDQSLEHPTENEV